MLADVFSVCLTLQGPIGFPGDMGAPGEPGVNVSIFTDVSRRRFVK